MLIYSIFIFFCYSFVILNMALPLFHIVKPLSISLFRVIFLIYTSGIFSFRRFLPAKIGILSISAYMSRADYSEARSFSDEKGGTRQMGRNMLWGTLLKNESLPRMGTSVSLYGNFRFFTWKLPLLYVETIVSLRGNGVYKLW